MPKRRMTPARKAAIAKWQKAGANARKAKATNKIPRKAYETKAQRGPMVTLYHATLPQHADAIRRNGFQWKEGRNLSMSGVKNPIWFNTKKPNSGAGQPLDWVVEKFGKPIGKGIDKSTGLPAFIYPKPVLFSVRIPYKRTKRDKHVPPGSKNIKSRVVSADYLRGVKIREIK